MKPIAFHETEQERQAVIHAYEKALSGNQLDVMLKRQNTLEFLKRPNEARAEHLRWYEDFIKVVEKKSGRAKRKR